MELWTAGIVTFNSHASGGWLGVRYIGLVGQKAGKYSILLYYCIFSVTFGSYDDFETWHYIVGQFKVKDANTVSYRAYLDGKLTGEENIIYW